MRNSLRSTARWTAIVVWAACGREALAIDLATICAQMGSAAAFGVVASASLTTKVGSAYVAPPDGFGVTLRGSVCTPLAKLTRTEILVDGAQAGDLVSARTSATAIKYARARGATIPARNTIAGSLVTGGAAVGPSVEVPGPGDLGGTIDTTGTHPAVAACAQAPISMVAASNFFASQPANQRLGTLFLAPGSTTTLAAAGGDVVYIDYLMLQGPNYRRGTSCTTSPGARVEVAIDPPGPVVINLLNVHPLPCGSLTVAGLGGPVIVNVVGTYRTLHVHPGENFAGLLAPLRTIKISGAQDGVPAQLGYVFAKKLQITGPAAVGGALPCP